VATSLPCLSPGGVCVCVCVCVCVVCVHACVRMCVCVCAVCIERVFVGEFGIDK
jgi:hypothetical protein